MKIIRSAVALVALVLLAGCAADLAKLQSVYTFVTTATVPASIVRPAATTFDVLKGTAANFAVYCVSNKFVPAGCDIDTRRKISTFVRDGTNARVQLRASLKTGQPALSTIYNALVDAVTGLQDTPAATFTGG